MFPKFTIEDGFAEDDPYWGKKESFDDVKARANSILDSIFDTDNDIQHTDDRMFEDERFGRYLRGAWAAFARDPERGLVK